MREILSRGKYVVNGEWVEGYYVRLHDSKGHESHRIYTGYAETDCGDFYPDWFEVDPATVGRYTGLPDKNGKKIFEGDIVDASETWWASCGAAGHSSPIIPVKWACDICGFDPFADYDRDCGVYIYGNEVEVIGNIHDNPELLEEVKSNAEV